MSNLVWKAEVGPVAHDGRVLVNFVEGVRLAIGDEVFVRGINFCGMQLDRGEWVAELATAKRDAALQLRRIADEIAEHAKDLEKEAKACETA